MNITECLATTFPELFRLSLGNLFVLILRLNVYFGSSDLEILDLEDFSHVQFSFEVLDT